MSYLKQLFLTLTIALSLALVGCGSDEPKLNASSEKAFEASIEKMTENLSREEMIELQEALVVLISNKIDMESMMRAARNGNIQELQEKSQKPYRDLHGLTAKEIIAKAKKEAGN